MRRYSAAIIGQKRIANNVFEITLTRPDKFEFRAGQYIQLSLPQLLYADHIGSSRVMSIASSPHVRNNISIVFRDTGSGFKQTLIELGAGSVITIDGPYGYLTLPEKTSRKIILIAGGIGVTPFLSMFRYAAATKLNMSLTMVYVNRNEESTAYMKELQELARHNRSLKVHPYFGKIDKQFIVDHVTYLDSHIWYISGPVAMVQSTRNLLFNMGVDDDYIRLEEFTGYA